MQTNLTFPMSLELQSATEDKSMGYDFYTANPGIVLSSEFRAITGDLIEQINHLCATGGILRRRGA